MPRFFLSDENIRDGVIRIEDSDAAHIVLSLRMTVGDNIVVCDFSGREYTCKIVSAEVGGVLAQIQSFRESSNETPYFAVLYQALAKGDRFDMIVQKSVECGVSKIVPVLTERCISRPDAAASVKKVARWRKISQEAAKQCGRAIIPAVSEIITYGEALTQMTESGIGFLCYEGDGTVPLGRSLRRVIKNSGYRIDGDISFMVGPEGGFSGFEVDRAKEAGLALTGLGSRILRCETAAPFVLACLSYEFELE